MLDAGARGKIEPGLLPVPASRGPVIDGDALPETLDDRRVAAAARAVLDPEPPFDAAHRAHNDDRPLLRHPRVILAPHMAGSTAHTQRRIAFHLAELVAACLG